MTAWRRRCRRSGWDGTSFVWDGSAGRESLMDMGLARSLRIFAMGVSALGESVVVGDYGNAPTPRRADCRVCGGG